VIFEFKDTNFTRTVDLSQGIEIGIPIQRGSGVSSFDIDSAKYQVYQKNGFIGSKNKGGSCNLETITFTPHGNGTHTECFGHISSNNHYVNDFIKDYFYSALLFTAHSIEVDGQPTLDFNNLKLDAEKNIKSLIIRSLPNEKNKINFNYSGQNTPYIIPNDMEKLVQMGIEHLIIDLPSVDPEWDEGKLASHHIFWNYPNSPRTHCSITEFVYIPNNIPDGEYLVKLNISNFISDAAPSRPIIYPLINS
jgi:kynurenine formamidase